MVGHTFLFNAAVRDLKRRIDAGEVGKVHYLYSQRLNLGIVRERRQRLVEPGAPRRLDLQLPAQRSDPVEVSRERRPRAAARGRRLDDVVFLSITLRERRRDARARLVAGPAQGPHDDGRRRQADDRLRRRQRRQAATSTTAASRAAIRCIVEQPTDFARFKMITRAGDLTIPNLRVPEPLSPWSAAHFAECVVQREERPLTDGWSGVAVTAVLWRPRTDRCSAAAERVDVPTS
jgi:hypothetical protein